MFVLNLIRWFVGYVVFTVEGNGQERFVNLCARFGYTIWNVRRKEYFFVSISRTKYRMLKNLAKQTGVKIRIYKKHGLPFVMHKFPNIKGMLAGLAEIYAKSIDDCISGNCVDFLKHQRQFCYHSHW